MDTIFTQFPTKESFDAYWKANYKPLSYQDVQAEYEKYVEEAEKHIFIEDYEAAKAISQSDFMENLSSDAQFFFQDTLTEVFYDKNPEVYETAFAIFEEAQLNGGDAKIAETFHEEYNRLYQEFLMTMYQTFFEKE